MWANLSAHTLFMLKEGFYSSQKEAPIVLTKNFDFLVMMTILQVVG